LEENREGITNLSKVVPKSLEVLVDHPSGPRFEPPREPHDQGVQERESLGNLEGESSVEVDRASLFEDEVHENLDPSRVGLVEVVAAREKVY